MMSWPLGSITTPAAATSSLLRASPPANIASVLSASGFCLGTLPLEDQVQLPLDGPRYRHPPSHVPCKTNRPGSRRLCAGHRLASQRASAKLIPRGSRGPSVLMPPRNYDASTATPAQCLFLFTYRRTILVRLPDPHLTRSRRAFSLSLTTTVFSQRSTGWFSACPRGRRWRAIPPCLAQHCFYEASYICTSFSIRDAPTALLLNSNAMHGISQTEWTKR